MRRPTFATLVAGIWAASSAAAISVAEKRVAFAGDASEISSSSSLDCHRSFPAFVWAGSKAGVDQYPTYRHGSRDANEVAGLLVHLAGEADKLEAVVVVLSQGDSFSTAGVSEANAIAKAGGASGMSALNAKSATHTMPYTYPGTTALTKILPDLASEVGAPVEEMTLEEVIPTAHENGMLSDRKMDFVIVTVPGTASVQETDAAIHTLVKNLEEQSKGQFMLLWTGDFHDPSCGRSSLSAEAAVHRRLQTEETEFRDIKITPDILAGLLTLLLFLFIMVTGLSCVGDIECPKSFATVMPAAGREY